jgi:phosphoenolpyruvate carboxykinase (ATP)
MKRIYQKIGLKLKNPTKRIYLDRPNGLYVEHTIKKGHGVLSRTGALIVETGEKKGRAADDKYVVASSDTKQNIWWKNNIRSMTNSQFNGIKKQVVDYLNQTRDLYVTNRTLGANHKYSVPVTTVTTHPASALFTKHLFRAGINLWNGNNLPNSKHPQAEESFIILHAPILKIDPKKFKTNSETVIAINFEQKIIIIANTLYAGELKKSMFCVLNYLIPEKKVLPMHASANQDEKGKVSVFFGLSGTGKTTLSADSKHDLIGDDEHGLNDNGVFNFEGGCYAKTHNLTQGKEPQIFRAANRFGAMLENVIYNEKNRVVDFTDSSLTENGRASYPLDFLNKFVKSSQGEIPSNIFFLTADAFGVMPPVAKLSSKQTYDYFILGYTSKLAGTEVGIKEPEANFSTCFGAPFMFRYPKVYANLLKKYVKKYKINVWLINTGWIGGKYGTGYRIPLKYSRKIVWAIQEGDLTKSKKSFKKDPYFNLEIPISCPGVPKNILSPKENWQDKTAYDEAAQKLNQMFEAKLKELS